MTEKEKIEEWKKMPKEEKKKRLKYLKGARKIVKANIKAQETWVKVQEAGLNDIKPEEFGIEDLIEYIKYMGCCENLAIAKKSLEKNRENLKNLRKTIKKFRKAK